MNKLLLRKERLPIRCEICHQADCFNAQNDYCQRCIGIKQTLALQVNTELYNSIPTIETQQEMPIYLIILSFVGAFIGFIIYSTLIGSPPIYSMDGFLMASSFILGQYIPILFLSRYKRIQASTKILLWQAAGVLGVFIGSVMIPLLHIFYVEVNRSANLLLAIKSIYNDIIINFSIVISFGVLLAPIGVLLAPLGIGLYIFLRKYYQQLRKR